MPWTRTCAIVGVALAVVAGTVRADVATPRPKWTTVQMAAETVQIALGSQRVQVDATFTMHNTGAASTVRMGYPLGEFEQALNDLAVTVDGQTVKGIQTQAGTQSAAPGRRPRGRAPRGVAAEPYRFEGPYKEWKVFDVPFGANEKKAVRVRYWVAPAQVTDKEKGRLLFYGYTLKTGATWKGTIGEATITVALDDAKCDLIRVVPGGYKKSTDGKKLVWQMKDFEPADNIEITFRPQESVAAGQ